MQGYTPLAIASSAPQRLAEPPSLDPRSVPPDIAPHLDELTQAFRLPEIEDRMEALNAICRRYVAAAAAPADPADQSKRARRQQERDAALAIAARHRAEVQAKRAAHRAFWTFAIEHGLANDIRLDVRRVEDWTGRIDASANDWLAAKHNLIGEEEAPDDVPDWAAPTEFDLENAGVAVTLPKGFVLAHAAGAATGYQTVTSDTTRVVLTISGTQLSLRFSPAVSISMNNWFLLDGAWSASTYDFRAGAVTETSLDRSGALGVVDAEIGKAILEVFRELVCGTALGQVSWPSPDQIAVPQLDLGKTLEALKTNMIAGCEDYEPAPQPTRKIPIFTPKDPDNPGAMPTEVDGAAGEDPFAGWEFSLKEVPEDQFSAHGDAARLRVALVGKTPSPARAIRILAQGRDRVQQVASAYRATFGRDLAEDLASTVAADRNPRRWEPLKSVLERAQIPMPPTEVLDDVACAPEGWQIGASRGGSFVRQGEKETLSFAPPGERFHRAQWYCYNDPMAAGAPDRVAGPAAMNGAPRDWDANWVHAGTHTVMLRLQRTPDSPAIWLERQRQVKGIADPDLSQITEITPFARLRNGDAIRIDADDNYVALASGADVSLSFTLAGDAEQAARLTDDLSAARISRVEVVSNAGIELNGLVKLHKVAIEGGRVAIDERRITLLDKARQVEGVEEVLRNVGSVLKFVANFKRYALGKAPPPPREASLTKGVTAATLEQILTEVLAETLAENNDLVPGIDLASLLGVGE